MIIGRGMLATVFSRYENIDDVVIFASGVSNSLEVRDAEFEREKKLLEETLISDSNKLLVYFSTCSMHDPSSKNSEYVQHKIAMEKIIINTARKYYIFRISQIVGFANNKTLINHLKNKIMSGEKIEIWKNSTRNLIDVTDVYKIIQYYIETKSNQNSVINIANPKNIHIQLVLTMLEEILNKKANYTLVNKGSPYDNIDIFKSKFAMDIKKIYFNDEYYFSLFKKYLSAEGLK